MNNDSSLAVVVDLLRAEVATRGPGERLPPSRALVRRWGISPVTLSRAVTVLIAEGLVISRPGAGVFVSDRAPQQLASPADLSWQELALSESSGQKLTPPDRPDQQLTPPDRPDHELSRPDRSGREIFRAQGLSEAPVRPAATAMMRMLWTPPDGVIDLSTGYLHETLQPSKALADAMGRAGRRPGTWTRAPAEGIGELRAWFADDIGGRGGPIGAEDVLISSGGQTALVTALRALTRPGQTVLVESPTYPGTLAAAGAAGLRCLPVPFDADGLRVELLDEAFARSGARVLVCQPLFQNPTGAVLAPDRRARLLDAAHAAGAFVVEDDFTRRLVHDDARDLPRPLAADDPHGHVVHIRSLTKPTSPSLRITAITARGRAFERLRDTHVINSFFVPRPLQETALELMTSPSYATHLRRLSTALRVRRETMVEALRDRCPHLTVHVVRPGGYHIWTTLPEDLPHEPPHDAAHDAAHDAPHDAARGAADARVAAAALAEGVSVSPGSTYYLPGGPTRHLRLSYVAASSTDELTRGIERLARALRQLR